MLNIFVPELSVVEYGIVRKLRTKRSSNIKIWLPKRIIQQDDRLKLWSDLKPVETVVNIDWNKQCFEWDLQTQNVSAVDSSFMFWLKMKEITNNESDKWLILSSNVRDKGQAALFIDHPTDKSYPNTWEIFKCISTENELDVFYKSLINSNFLTYCFGDSDFFKKRNDICLKGALVYQEERTGYLWYLDTLHNDHLEVFDPTGKKHIGEADLRTGKIDRSKSDKNKHIR